MPQDVATIRELNDHLRQTFSGGRVVMTDGVSALTPEVCAEVMQAVRTFDNFTTDNDPHGEHDFGDVVVRGLRFFWKIDYYDRELQYGSDDPSDASKTMRVLTIMLAEEY